MLTNYYALTKPGIIRGNAVTLLAGFLLASGRQVDGWLLLATVVGSSLIIASACVFNNYIDRDIDKKMARTKQRALVTGLIPARQAIIYAVILGIVGLALLSAYVNLLTAAIGLAGLFLYVVVYGFYKRRTVHGTIIGSLAGAVPPVAGYTAVTNRLDKAALILFLILVFWQMPHFYAIAIYRLKDYQAADIPVLPAVKGIPATKLQIVLYIAAFTIAASALSVFGYASLAYRVVALLLGIGWLYLGFKGYKSTDDSRWARQMFFFSLFVITALCIAISLDAVLA